MILVYALSPRQQLLPSNNHKLSLTLGAAICSAFSLWAYATALGIGYGVLTWVQSSLMCVCLVPLLILWKKAMFSSHTTKNSKVKQSKKNPPPSTRKKTPSSRTYKNRQWNESVWLKAIITLLFAPSLCFALMGCYAVLNGVNNTDAPFVMWLSVLWSLFAFSLCFLIKRASTLLLGLGVGNALCWLLLFQLQTSHTSMAFIP